MHDSDSSLDFEEETTNAGFDPRVFHEHEKHQDKDKGENSTETPGAPLKSDFTFQLEEATLLSKSSSLRDVEQSDMFAQCYLAIDYSNQDRRATQKPKLKQSLTRLSDLTYSDTELSRQ